MARLVVSRGEARDTQTLEKLPVRIGRGPQNDIVLEDPAKSVSRTHAELRLEGGRYFLVDLKSDNGIWVAGVRVPRVELKPNVIASIGPFRLMLEPDETTAADAGSETKVSPRPDAQRSRPSTPISRLKGPGGWTTSAKWAAAIAAGLVIAIAIIAGVILWPTAPVGPSPELVKQIASARSQIGQAACAEALAQHINPGLASNPGNAELLDLKRQAEACVAPPPSPPPPDPNAENLLRAKELIAAGDCSAALEPLNNVLTNQPEHSEALELKTQADACVPPPNTDRRPVLAKKIPPASGGLEPLTGELDRDYQIRVAEMRARYDAAVTTSSKGPSRAAIALFEGIAKETPPGYLDVSAKLAQATTAWRATARPLLTEGRELAAKEMWNEALQKFKEARAIDPNLSVDDDVRTVEAAKLAKGQQLCKLGKQTINYNRLQAVQHFKQAVALLPPDDPCYADAKRYVDTGGN